MEKGKESKGDLNGTAKERGGKRRGWGAERTREVGRKGMVREEEVPFAVLVVIFLLFSSSEDTKACRCGGAGCQQDQKCNRGQVECHGFVLPVLLLSTPCFEFVRGKNVWRAEYYVQSRQDKVMNKRVSRTLVPALIIMSFTKIDEYWLIFPLEL